MGSEVVRQPGGPRRKGRPGSISEGRPCSRAWALCLCGEGRGTGRSWAGTCEAPGVHPGLLPERDAGCSVLGQATGAGPGGFLALQPCSLPGPP